MSLLPCNSPPLIVELHGEVPALQEQEEGGGERQQGKELTPSIREVLIDKSLKKIQKSITRLTLNTHHPPIKV